MPLDPVDIAAAEALQHAAARDVRAEVLVVAGPGTGKSATIEERFRWLFIDQKASPSTVFGVSFTRAASKDLKLRVEQYCADHKLMLSMDAVRVSTLHSLALTTLAKADLLQDYPVRPVVLDDWEVKNIFDTEFAVSSQSPKGRCEEIRKSREAFWSTDDPNPANYIPPDPPVTEAELRRFDSFHGPTKQVYACVLPGEIVRMCVEEIEAGLLVPADVLGMRHLIVDEYQDLNPMDIRFVDALGASGTSLLVAGDDDQSIYAFRFASPIGIQEFTVRYPTAGNHTLDGCFRCASSIVEGANALIGNFSPSARLPKELRSLWESATPQVTGVVRRIRFDLDSKEADAIAQSCKELIAAGVTAQKIMILLSNKRLFPAIKARLEAASVPFSPFREEPWRDTPAGRFLVGMLRVIANDEDYVALRLILGCRRGVGPGTCVAIVDRVVQSNVGYRALFYDPELPDGLSAKQRSSLEAARSVCASLADWSLEDTVSSRQDVFRNLLADACGEDKSFGWDVLVETLPDDATLSEARDYLWTDNTEQQHNLLVAIHERLGIAPPDTPPEAGVRVMTMHGAKGLQADVVFIPGLEEEILPGPKRAVVPGLVLEAARLLYVSMTRARAALVLTFSTRRCWMGAMQGHHRSRFNPRLGGTWDYRQTGLSAEEVGQVVGAIQDMRPPTSKEAGEADAEAQ